MGVPLSEEKTIGPTTKLEFLGIMLDSVSMKASLPEEKLVRIRDFLKSCLELSSLPKRQLLSLLGHLNFAMRIIPQGRSFVSRLLDLAKSVPNLNDEIILDEGCKSDICFWSALLDNWNGISFFYNDVVETSSSLKFFTDAAPSVGFGGFYDNQWFAEAWPPEILASDYKSIALFELYPIVLACLMWGKEWKRKQITVFCDNESTVNIINKGRSSVPMINSLIRRLSWTCINDNFILRASHIPGYKNSIADSLSRFKFQEFKALCPNSKPTSLSCPPFSQAILN